MFFVTCSKLRERVKVGVRHVGGCFLGLLWVTSARVQSPALLEPSLAFGNPASVLGDVDRLCGGILVMSRPRDGGPPHWSLLLVMTSPPFSPGTQHVGQFGGHRRKNSKSLTYFISKVEKDQTVTKINNFSIVFWWPWARWPWQGHWKGEGPG